MKLFWMGLAGIGIVIAAFFLWRRDFDKAFVMAALGMVAWFLNYRAQMKEITADLDDKNNRDEVENVDDQNDN